MSDIAASEEAGPLAPPPRQVLYCAICTFPPEYCEFGDRSTKCRTWLEGAHPDLHAKLWSTEAIEANMSKMTTKQAEDLEKDAEKKEKRAEKKAEKELAEKKSSKIVLTKMSRTKRKATTSIVGLHLFSPPLPALKVIAKGLSGRLATGASVSKTASNPGIDEIVVQGDVADEVRVMILERQKPFHELPAEKDGGVTAKNVVVEEEKKKKTEGEEGGEDGAGAEAAPPPSGKKGRKGK